VKVWRRRRQAKESTDCQERFEELGLAALGVAIEHWTLLNSEAKERNTRCDAEADLNRQRRLPKPAIADEQVHGPHAKKPFYEVGFFRFLSDFLF
jgi:hypothetical protein